MKWNPFKKHTDDKEKKDSRPPLTDLPGAPKLEEMGMMERFAYKRFLKMNREDQEKVLKKAMTPKNIEKHKDEIVAQLEAMRKSGQMSDDQYRLAKKKLGLK